MKGFVTIVWAMSLGLGGVASAESINRVGARMDCLTDLNKDKGESQNCFSISGLRYQHTEKIGPKMHARVSFDPFALVDADSHPNRSRVPSVRETSRLIVDDYAFVWVPRPNLEVALEQFHNTAKIPNMSGLSMGGNLAARPWSQTAISVTYNLSAFGGTKVKFVAGNGEGENGRNLDPQQYFGFMTEASLFEGLKVTLGAGFDGNNVGSEQYEYKLERLRTVCGVDFTDIPKQGFSTQRIAVGAALDGKWVAARGLRIGLGWQRNVSSDLDKDEQSLPTQEDQATCPQLSVNNLVVEDPNGEAVNTVQNRVIGFSMSYRILDTYMVGLDYESRTVDTGSVKIFEVCDGFQGTSCEAPGEEVNSLSQSAVTIGGGVDLAERLSLTLDYNRKTYDKSYTQFFYTARGDKADVTSELFNVRISYNWDR